MKNFKDFELTSEQQLNTIGKGKPAWAGVKASERNAEFGYEGEAWVQGEDGEYINPTAKPEDDLDVETPEVG